MWLLRERQKTKMAAWVLDLLIVMQLFLMPWSWDLEWLALLSHLNTPPLHPVLNKSSLLFPLRVLLSLIPSTICMCQQAHTHTHTKLILSNSVYGKELSIDLCQNISYGNTRGWSLYLLYFIDRIKKKPKREIGFLNVTQLSWKNPGANLLIPIQISFCLIQAGFLNFLVAVTFLLPL